MGWDGMGWDGKVLEGHTDDAEFALATCRTAPLVASGGKDMCVLMWSLEDHMSTLTGPAVRLNTGPKLETLNCLQKKCWGSVEG